MVSPRPPSIPRDLTSTSLDQSTVPTELSRSVRQDVRSVSTRLGPVNTAFFASQGMQPPGVSRELRFGDSASAGQDRVPPAASTPPGLVSATQTFPASGKGIESPTSGQPVLARGPERSPPSELDVDEGAAPRDPSSSLASVGEESEAETSAQPGALTPSLPAMEAEGQIGSADGTGGVKSAAGNRRDLSASLGPVNTAFFRSQGMEPPGSSGSVAEGADLEPAKASSVNTPPAVKGAAAGSTLEGVHTEWGTGAPGGMAASELPVKVGAEGAGQERTRVFSEGIPREARPEESPEALNVKGEAKGGASKGRSEGVASEVGASDASKPVSADLRDVSAGGETENEVPVALSSVVVKDAKVGLGESASRVGKGAGVEAVQMSTGASESEKPGAGDSGARSLESSRLGPLVATPAISEGKDSGAGKSTTDFLGGSGPVTAAVVSEGTKLGAGDPTEARPQPELEKSEPDIARESGVTEGAEDVKSQPAPYAPTNPSQTPEQAAPASLSAVSGRGAEPTGREAIIEAEKPVKVKVSNSGTTTWLQELLQDLYVRLP